MSRVARARHSFGDSRPRSLGYCYIARSGDACCGRANERRVIGTTDGFGAMVPNICPRIAVAASWSQTIKLTRTSRLPNCSESPGCRSFEEERPLASLMAARGPAVTLRRTSRIKNAERARQPMSAWADKCVELLVAPRHNANCIRVLGDRTRLHGRRSVILREATLSLGSASSL